MRRIRYIWEQPAWPDFDWDDTRLLAPLAAVSHKHGQFLGRMAGLGFDLRLEAQVAAVAEETLKTSEIEGEHLNAASVRSSVAKRLGLAEAGLRHKDRTVDGVVEVMVDATAHAGKSLTKARLLAWHASLFADGPVNIRVGAFRRDDDGPMQVVSGRLGRQTVHYEAPPAPRVAKEVAAFLAWFNGPSEGDGLLRAAIAHLWFVTIHPFDDGNGRLSRAIGDMALAQLEGSQQRFYSVSSQIQRERADYYDVLEQTQKSVLDVTAWLVWFLGCFGRAIDAAEVESHKVLQKAEFYRRFALEPLSERQKKVINRLFADFDGALTAKKWAALGKCSVDTAQRDITDLVARGLLRKNAGGSKNTSYALTA